MDHKTKGMLLGVAGMVLWFMPLVRSGFFGFYLSGQHIGSIAHLLFASSIAYAASSWFEQHQLRIIAGSVAAVICLLILLEAGSHAVWGLYALTAVSAVAVVSALIDNKKAKQSVSR